MSRIGYVSIAVHIIVAMYQVVPNAGEVAWSQKSTMECCIKLQEVFLEKRNNWRNENGSTINCRFI